MIKAQTLKGFRDFLPEAAIARQIVVEKIRSVFERYGFDPIETPALEYAETLLGKYGNEADKLLYLFRDNGKRKVGLRYDQTVPLSRVVAQYGSAGSPQVLPMPFKRYQIQPVWRAENTQKGRFREFLQCDIDTIGSDSPLADAEIIDCTLNTFKQLGFSGITMDVNDRTIFNELKMSKKEITIVDKLSKIGKDAVIKELGKPTLFESLAGAKPTERVWKIFEALKKLGYKEDVDFRFHPFLARGLDYYTSTIFELKTDAYPAGSLAGGGRYDTLIGQFSGTDQPAVGIAFGFDRIMEALGEFNLLPAESTATELLVTFFSPKQLGASLELTTALRRAGLNTEVYVDTGAKLDKQLKYADKKGIPYVVIAGPDEVARSVIKLKTMETKKQEELTVDDVIDKLTKAS